MTVCLEYKQKIEIVKLNTVGEKHIMHYLLSHWKDLYLTTNVLETTEGKKWIENKSFYFQIFTVDSVQNSGEGRKYISNKSC